MDRPEARDTQLAERANTLYWESDDSVNDIAEGLDLSKGSLYGMISPRPAGIACPECAAELEHPNRTARDKGFVTCPGCGLEEEEAVVLTLAGDTVPAGAAGHDSGASTRTLWATVLLGAAAGMLLVRWARR
ncbi:MAG: hypothetical protein HKN71_09985 [Gemmatimonadetes bacterium]|nr:hypothetical protein [Gemmatimonadota bacterium]